MKPIEDSDIEEPFIISLIHSLMNKNVKVYYRKRPQSNFEIIKFEPDIQEKDTIPASEPYWVLVWNGSHGQEHEWFNPADLREMTLEKSDIPNLPGVIFKKKENA
jgi:hypothetical protein